MIFRVFCMAWEWPVNPCFAPILQCFLKELPLKQPFLVIFSELLFQLQIPIFSDFLIFSELTCSLFLATIPNFLSPK